MKMQAGRPAQNTFTRDLGAAADQLGVKFILMVVTSPHLTSKSLSRPQTNNVSGSFL